MSVDQLSLSAKRIALLNLLADGQLHSGEQLALQLGITRAAISKHIRALRALGLQLQSTTGVGYQLKQPLLWLDPAQLTTALGRVTYFHLIDSTNAYFSRQSNTLVCGEVCFAEGQTKGRGRRGRHWYSPLSSQLIFSLFWRLQGGMLAAMGLSLVVGLSIICTLERLGVPDLALKWSNDLLGRGRKLGGILIELTGSPGDYCDAIIGVGINTSLSRQQGQNIEQPWISLSDLLPGRQTIDRTCLGIEIVKQLRKDLLCYDRYGFSAFHQDWQARDYFWQKPVTVFHHDWQVKGIAQGVNTQGALLLETPIGLMSIYSGEVSLRATV